MKRVNTILIFQIVVLSACHETPRSEPDTKPKNCSVLIQKADEFREMDLPLETIKFLEEAKKNGCTNSRLHINLGDAYFKTEQVEKAVHEFESAKAYDPNLVLIYSNLGISYSILNENGLATNSFLKAIDLESDNAENYYYLGNHQHLNNNLIGAKLNLNKAVKLDSKNSVFLLKRAAIVADMGDFESAISDSNKALALNPEIADKIDLFWIKTMCFIELANIDSACYHFDRLKKLDAETDYSYIDLECN
jgi:tetratricopeptide (TPR) repeat protein